MINKIYAEIKKIVYSHFKSILFFLILFILCTIPLPYYIDTPGGAMNIKEKIELENPYESRGSFNFAYVSELKATPITYLLSFFKKDWKRVKKSDIAYGNETIKSMEFRDHLSLIEANDNAVITAYNALHKKVTIEQVQFYITYIDPKAKTNLKVGDEILSVDSQKITQKEDLLYIIKSHEPDDEINIEVLSKKKKVKKKATLYEEDGQIFIGIMIGVDKTLQTNPPIKILSNKNESGPSGGLMLTLAIYNALTKEDITKGSKIVGTGTIDEKGNVGDIGGVSFKLKGAVKEKADIFLVPNGKNYKEAIKLKEERNYNIEIKGVSTFEEALMYLKMRK